MKRYFKLAAVCAAFVLSVAMCASAGSTDHFSGTLNGVSESVSGSFTFNSPTDSFSNIKLSFTGSTFGSVNASDPSGGQGTCQNGVCGFLWKTQVGSDTIWDLIVVTLSTGQFQDAGTISNSRNNGGFNYMSVPEGSSALAYLLLSAGAIFGGIFMSGKNRRTAKST
jgi:hypothetical protein